MMHEGGIEVEGDLIYSLINLIRDASARTSPWSLVATEPSGAYVPYWTTGYKHGHSRLTSRAIVSAVRDWVVETDKRMLLRDDGIKCTWNAIRKQAQVVNGV